MEVVKVQESPGNRQRGNPTNKPGLFERFVQVTALVTVIAVIAFICYLADLIVTHFA